VSGDKKSRRQPAAGIVLMVVGLWVLGGLSVYLHLLRSGVSATAIASQMGAAPAALAQYLFGGFGHYSWFLPILILLWGGSIAAGRKAGEAAKPGAWLAVLGWLVCIIV
jgi:hypothetical protein